MRATLSVLLLLALALPCPAGEKKPKVKGHAAQRVRENLDRGLIVRPVEGDKVYVGWRLLADDPTGVAFDVYRRKPGAAPVKLNEKPITKTTDLVVPAPAKPGPWLYHVTSIVNGQERECSTEVRLPSPARGRGAGGEGAPPALPYLSIKLDGRTTFQKVGIADLDGDGRYDYVIKQPRDNIDPWYKYWKPSPDTYKLEACSHDGKLLWRYDLGWAIERGIWYSPYLVYDFDGDGRAEVAVKTGKGDPREPDGHVLKGPEYLTILDGRTGKPVAQVDWPSREGFEGEHGYNYASRNQLGVAYLDGKTPCLIAARGTYNLMKAVAYELHDGRLRELWRWDNAKLPRKFQGQGAHWMHCADVDGDGRDEVLLGSIVLDDDGSVLWCTGLGHPDHFFLGDIDPQRPGLEIYYGMETRQKQRNGMCLVEAATGKILWGHEGATRHVHGQGMCSDIDARYPGSECYSADTDSAKKLAWARLRTCQGKVISEENLGGFSPPCVHWDADPQRELLRRGRIADYQGKDMAPRVEGSLVAVADVLGDWREEIITSVPGELRIYTTTIPAADRRACLMQDPVYRNDVTHAAMGYYQVPMLSYDVATGHDHGAPAPKQSGRLEQGKQPKRVIRGTMIALAGNFMPGAGSTRGARKPLSAPVAFDTPKADAVLSALEVFPPDNPWNQVVEDWPLHPNSKRIIASIGAGKPLRYNPDMGFVLVPPNQKRVEVKVVGYPGESDKGPFPVPANVPIEGWPVCALRDPSCKGWTLDDIQRDKAGRGGDRHGIVVDPVHRMLYEFYALRKTDAGWQAAQASVFDLKTNRLRPDGWTSADAAGLPIFPAVVRYDELKRGIVRHAMRVTVRKTRRAYVAPATHFASRHADPDYPRMGERIRLRRDFDVSGFSPEVQAILKGLKRYGMFVADNGIEWAISVAPDPRIPVLHEELRRIKGSAFEVVVAPK